MQVKDLAVIILAAGKGTRMKSSLAKVLHPLSSRPILAYLLDTVQTLSPKEILLVVGHQADKVESQFQNPAYKFVLQKEQLGTGHAVMQTEAELSDFDGDVLILCGDMPFLRSATLEELIRRHREAEAKCTLLALKSKEAKDFGRVFHNTDGSVERIIEDRDATATEKMVDEYNAGVYCFNKGFLFKALAEIGNDNTQNEYYLTDTIKHLAGWGFRVQSIITQDAEEILGINSLADLKIAEEILLKR
jgi:UDP-N-acetylglucosamine diphosphorylase/glucosamine-1-phosphate N-acetyltransferase